MAAIQKARVEKYPEHARLWEERLEPRGEAGAKDRASSTRRFSQPTEAPPLKGPQESFSQCPLPQPLEFRTGHLCLIWSLHLTSSR